MATSQATAKESYSFGIVPQYEARTLFGIWLPIIERLEAKTGYKFNLVGASTIPVFEKEFADGQFDFAYMNPYHFLVARQKQGYLPLIRDDAKKLFGILVVRKDGGIDNIQQLSGQDIAFPSPNALGASLLMRAELTNISGISFQPLYAETHPSVYMNVLTGKTLAGGGVMRTFNELGQASKEQLRIIYKTQGITPHPIVAHPRVNPKVRQQVMQALLDLNNDPEGKALLKKVPIDHAVAAAANDYQALDGMKLEDFYVAE